MKRQLKKSIQKAFEAPEPDWQEKKRFLSTLSRSRISLLRLILIQAAYLRKRTWFLSVLLVLPALLGARYMDPDTLWAVSVLVPFLGLAAVAEGARSAVYGMEEFEMSTRFSLKSVALARMSVWGALDMLILCVLIFLCHVESSQSLLQTGLYLLVPYLLTVNISLWITRHLRGRDAVYACSGVAALVSGVNAGLRFLAELVYEASCLKWWAILFVILAAAMIYEGYCTIKQTEEWAWNL